MQKHEAVDIPLHCRVHAIAAGIQGTRYCCRMLQVLQGEVARNSHAANSSMQPIVKLQDRWSPEDLHLHTSRESSLAIMMRAPVTTGVQLIACPGLKERVDRETALKSLPPAC